MTTPEAGHLPVQEERQLTELISLFQLAMKNIRLYPAGHDLVKTRTKAAYQLLSRLLGRKHLLQFGVARDTITFAGQPIGETIPACSSFAMTLSRHEIASLTFSQGVSQHSLFLFLKTAGVPPEQSEQGTTLAQELASLNISHIEIQTVDYSHFDRMPEDSSHQDGKDSAKQAENDTTTWLNFTKKLTNGTLGYGDSSVQGEAQTPAGASAEKLAAAITSQSQNLPGIMQEFSLLLDHLLQASPGEHPVRPASSSQELSAVLTELNPKLRDQFLMATLKKCDQNRDRTDPEFILGTFSDTLVIDMLKLVNRKGVAVSPALVNLIQKLSRIRFSQEGSLPSAMSGQEITSLLMPEKYDQYVDTDYHATLHGLSHRPSDAPPAVDFPLQEHLLTLEEEHLNNQLIRATLIFMEGTEGETDYREFADKLMELTFQLPETGAFELLLSIARTLKRHASRKQSAAIKKIAEECLEELTDSDFLDCVLSAMADHRIGDEEQGIAFLTQLCPEALDTLLKIFCMQPTFSNFDPLLTVFKTFRLETLTRIFTILPKQNSARIHKLLTLLPSLGTSGTVPLLRPLLKHGDLQIRTQVLDLLIPLRDKEALACLKSMLREREEFTVETAIELCNRHRLNEYVPDLLELLEYQFIKEAAIERNRKLLLALGHIGDKRALPALDKLAFTKWPLHRQLVSNMKRILFYSLKGYQPTERKELVRKGLQIKDQEIRKICTALLSPKERMEAGL